MSERNAFCRAFDRGWLRIRTDSFCGRHLCRIRHKFIREHSQLNPDELDDTEAESQASTALSSLFPQPEKHWSTELSKYLWRNCNPGYMLKTQKVPSTMKEHFAYDEEEVSEC